MLIQELMQFKGEETVSALMEMKDFSKNLEAFMDQESIHNFEGRRGLINLAKIAVALGYKDSQYYGNLAKGAHLGDIINFFEDNSGALAAVVEWIMGQRSTTEWNEHLESMLEDGRGDDEEQHESVQEAVKLDEKVFDNDRYDWYVWTEKKPSKMFDRRGGAKQIERGMQFGLRAATSKPGTWRMVLKQKGPSIIFSIAAGDAQALIDTALELK